MCCCLSPPCSAFVLPRVGIDIELLNPGRELFDRRLTVEPCGIKRAMSQQCRQSNEVSWILPEVIAREGVPQRVRTCLLWHQVASGFDQISNHLSHCRSRERASFLALEDGFKCPWRSGFGPFGSDHLDRRFLVAKPRSHIG